jgi:hypothetical protein
MFSRNFRPTKVRSSHFGRQVIAHTDITMQVQIIGILLSFVPCVPTELATSRNANAQSWERVSLVFRFWFRT